MPRARDGGEELKIVKKIVTEISSVKEKPDEQVARNLAAYAFLKKYPEESFT